jgi:hypothetical protein
MSDLSARPAAGGIFRYGLSVALVALSPGLTLLLQDYTFRTPLFSRHHFEHLVWRHRPGLLAVVLATLSINFSSWSRDSPLIYFSRFCPSRCFLLRLTH